MRKISILGDSISTFEGCNPAGFAVFYTAERAASVGLAGAQDTWWGLLAARLGAHVLANASYSGSMVAGAGFPAAWSPERIAALAGPAGEHPDDVVVFMGTNDYGWGSARAQVAARSSATPLCSDFSAVPESVAGLAPASAVYDFEQAYDRMLKAVRAAYPCAQVWCCTLLPGRVEKSPLPTFVWNLRGAPMTHYNGGIARVARANKALLVDTTTYGLDYEAIEGTHPTALGMRQICALVFASMQGLGCPDLEPFGGAPAPLSPWSSHDWCPNRPCVGCAHARDTGNSWYCVCTKDRAGA